MGRSVPRDAFDTRSGTGEVERLRPPDNALPGMAVRRALVCRTAHSQDREGDILVHPPNLTNPPAANATTTWAPCL